MKNHTPSPEVITDANQAAYPAADPATPMSGLNLSFDFPLPGDTYWERETRRWKVADKRQRTRCLIRIPRNQ